MIFRLVLALSTLFALVVCPVSAWAQLRADVVVSGLSQPLGFVQDPSNPSVHFVVQKGGRIRVLVNGALQPTDFLNLTSQVSTSFEQGLLGLAFAPDYATSGRFYVNFTNAAGNTVIARFERSSSNPLVADAASRFDLRWPGGQRFIAQPGPNHNGGHLMFGPDGFLYIGLGDGGAADDPDHAAQNPATLLGKMLRIDVDVPDTDAEGYDIPAGNPFVGNASVLDEIWSFGLRNPWRYSFDDPARGGTGALIIADVGQALREEIDYEPAGAGGRNYGWRNREGTVDYITSLPPAFLPLTDPVFDYAHDAGQSVTGGFVYRGSALNASYRGRYFFADFIVGRVWSLGLSVDPNTGEAVALNVTDHTAELSRTADLGRISSFGVDSQGELHIASFNGTIFRLAPALGPPNPLLHIDLPSSGATVTQPFLIAGWALDGNRSTDPGVSTLHAWAFPTSGGSPIFLGVPTYGGSRPDVGAAFGAQFTASGFGLSVSGLPPGSYRLAVYAWITALNGWGIVRSVDVTIEPSAVMWIDLPFNGATVTQPFHLAGWAIDRDAASGTGIDTIHVWAYPVAGGPPTFVGVPILGGSRPDVAAHFGSSQFTASGYNLGVSGLSAGIYDIVVYVHSAVTNTFAAAQVVRVTVN